MEGEDTGGKSQSQTGARRETTPDQNHTNTHSGRALSLSLSLCQKNEKPKAKSQKSVTSNVPEPLCRDFSLYSSSLSLTLSPSLPPSHFCCRLSSDGCSTLLSLSRFRLLLVLLRRKFPLCLLYCIAVPPSRPGALHWVMFVAWSIGFCLRFPSSARVRFSAPTVIAVGVSLSLCAVFDVSARRNSWSRRHADLVQRITGRGAPKRTVAGQKGRKGDGRSSTLGQSPNRRPGVAGDLARAPPRGFVGLRFLISRAT